MATAEAKLVATSRTTIGSSNSRRLRREGQLPGVIYADGKEGESIQLNQHEVEQFLRHHTSESVMLDLELADGKLKRVLLKQAQHHPVTGRVTHIDFQEVSLTKKLRLEVPIVLEGIPIGCSQGGGVLDQLFRNIEVESLPGDIIEQVELDVSNLNIGDRLLVRDIALDASKHKLITDSEIAVVAVAAPRVSEEEVAETTEDGDAPAEEGEAAATPDDKEKS